jgi:hypothetical protein
MWLHRITFAVDADKWTASHHGTFKLAKAPHYEMETQWVARKLIWTPPSKKVQSLVSRENRTLSSDSKPVNILANYLST